MGSVVPQLAWSRPGRFKGGGQSQGQKMRGGGPRVRAGANVSTSPSEMWPSAGGKTSFSRMYCSKVSHAVLVFFALCSHSNIRIITINKLALCIYIAPGQVLPTHVQCDSRNKYELDSGSSQPKQCIYISSWHTHSLSSGGP